MMLIPGGEFMMGDNRGEDDEKPAHKVKISGFYMDKYEVTQAAYERMMGRNPAKFKGPDKPVERVSWFGAIQYCNMRSLREGLTPCYNLDTLECNYEADGYRLPTEAEWEYACRSGTTTKYSFGNVQDKLDQHAWFKENANKTSHPVGQKRPDQWATTIAKTIIRKALLKIRSVRLRGTSVCCAVEAGPAVPRAFVLRVAIVRLRDSPTCASDMRHMDSDASEEQSRTHRARA
jgi:hypothetical protein